MFTAIFWPGTVLPVSLSAIVIVPVNVPPPSWRIDGLTVIVALFVGARLPRDGVTGAYVAAIASSLATQFSMALLVFVMVKVRGMGFVPFSVLKLNVCTCILMTGTGGRSEEHTSELQSQSKL